ncbi:Coproporphyrinogen III oxidase [Schizophyllum commune]
MSSDSASRPMRERVAEFVTALQDEIVGAFEKLDPNSPPFKRDSWVRAQGGSGRSCVFATPELDPATLGPNAQLPVLEKAGVNVSVVHGTLPGPAIRQMRGDHQSMPLPEELPGGLPFFAAGISLVIHPRNPHAPTTHANYRYFEICEAPAEGSSEPGQVIAWWFGGGSDLTPYYLYEEDAVHFHKTVKAAVEPHGSALYPAFKKWCDEYFYLPHRGEARGVGGIFFDDLNSGSHLKIPIPKEKEGDTKLRPYSQEECFQFLQSAGKSFVPSYLPILERRYKAPSTPLQRRWQLVRRGRYVEFNLMYDRGTKFGLMAPEPRVESILMSLPETVRWEYMTDLGGEGTEEGKLMHAVKHVREWA